MRTLEFSLMDVVLLQELVDKVGALVSLIPSQNPILLHRIFFKNILNFCEG